MKLYGFDSAGVFAGEREADVCQITGDPIMRVNATTIEPPEIDGDSVAVWTGERWGIFTPILPELPTIEDQRETMVLTKLDAKLRLLERGLYTQINDAIFAMDDCFLKVKWLNADFFKRLDIDLVAYLYSLGMTDEQIDDLFTAPNKL